MFYWQREIFGSATTPLGLCEHCPYQAKRRKVANSEALPFPRTLLLCQNLGWLFFGLRWTVRGKVGRHALLAMILYSIQRFAKMMTLIEIRGSIFWDSMAALPSCWMWAGLVFRSFVLMQPSPIVWRCGKWSNWQYWSKVLRQLQQLGIYHHWFQVSCLGNPFVVGAV